MAEKPKIVYSCPRKKDVVTFLALALFLGIVAFETYLVFILPVQLSRKNAMILQVEKQRLTALTDSVRFRLEVVSHKDLTCEHALITGVMDAIALYLRDHQDGMNAEQTSFLKQTIMKYNAIIDTWSPPMNRRRMKRNSFDASPYIIALERKCGVEERGRRRK